MTFDLGFSYLLYLLTYSLSFFSEKHPLEASDVKAEGVSIQVNNKDIYIDGKKLSLHPHLKELTTLLGNPSRKWIQSAKEIAQAKKEMGMTPSNIYTFDQHGILVYQEAGSTLVNTMVFEFSKRDFHFSSRNTFASDFEIDSVKLNNRSTVADLAKLPNVRFKKSAFLDSHEANLNGYKISIEFDLQNSGQLKCINLTPIDFSSEKMVDAWTDEGIDMLRTTIRTNDELNALIKDFRLNQKNLEDCIIGKVAASITITEMASGESQAAIGKIVEKCVSDARKKAARK